MKSELIFRYLPCNIHYKEQFISLPDEVRTEIKKCWKDTLSSGRRYTNGELFTIASMIDEGDCLDLSLYLTTYDHYIYSAKKNFVGRYICRSLAANILFLTSDGYYVLAVMSDRTSLPGKIKFIGGAFSKGDVKDGEIDAFHCIKREVKEEIGLDMENQNIFHHASPKYFVTRPNLSFLNILFVGALMIPQEELAAFFKEYKANTVSDDFELSDLYFLHNDSDSIKDFVAYNKQNFVSYMEELFLVLISEREAGNIKDKIKGR
jgi:8-oxo-dGTP pyrophosphatase MutT (NUDIX family)